MKNVAQNASTLHFILLLFTGVFMLSSGCSADCGWNGEAQTFIDENANAKWDSNELPLPKVKFTILDFQGHDGYGGGWESDSDGKANFAFFVSCNEDKNLIVHAVTPKGYTPTTPDRLETGSKNGKTFTFGFARSK